jgi:glycolate oxidase iron-sulfur subunit
MIQARHALLEKKGAPLVMRLMLTHMLPYPNRLRWLLKLSFLGKKLGISGLLRKIGLLGKIAPSLAAADELVEKVPLKFLLEHRRARNHREVVLSERQHQDILALHRKKEKSADRSVTDSIAARTRQQSRRSRVAFMPVCGSQYVRPSIGLATVALFEFLKIDFVIPDLICCGLPAASYGVMERVRAMACENIARLEHGRYEALVIDDSSCAAHMKDYPKLFEGNSDWLHRANDLSQRVREMSSFWLQRGLVEQMRKGRWKAGVVAFHDPCKAQYGQRVTSPPRELLAAIPGLTLVDVPEADQCCGGGGTYSFVHPELSREVGAAKIRNIISTGCEAVVTTSASCLTQLEFGLRQAGSRIQVFHLNELLELAVIAGRNRP